MTPEEKIQLGNLQGEVELLRELVAFLCAQLPHTQAKVDAMQQAFHNAKNAHADRSPEYISVAHAWNQQAERLERYEPLS